MSWRSCTVSPDARGGIDLDALRLGALAWMASHDWPAVTVEPTGDGRTYVAYVDDPDEPTWAEIDMESDVPPVRQLMAGLIRAAEAHAAAAVGLGWHAFFVGDVDDAPHPKGRSAPELVGIGLYDPSRPFDRPVRLRGPFELTRGTLRFLTTALRIHNSLLPAASESLMRWGLFPWCPFDDAR